MIPNTVPGTVVRIKHEQQASGEPRTYTVRYAVVAWDDDGYPLLAGPRGLCTPHEFGGNWVLEEPDPDPVVRVTPAPGWFVRYKAGDGSVYRTPLVGWGIRADGGVDPLQVDAEGYVETVDRLAGDSFLGLHHDEAWRAEGDESGGAE